MSSPAVPPAGVWAPAVTFFDPDTDEIDFDAQSKYFKYLSKHLTGLVVLGTNAETFLLTREERAKLVHTARQSVNAGYPIMAGVGGHSTKQVLEYINDAARAGADYVLVLPPAYFGKATTTKVIVNFFDEIASKSPIPILIYNFPGVCNGVDIDSDLILSLARKHDNIVGVKLTCASVGKITRLAAALDSDKFAIFGGQSDFLIAGLAVGSAGCIAAFANVLPKTIKQIYDMYAVRGMQKEAMALHQQAAQAESLIKSGIAATKYAASLTSAGWAGIVNATNKLQPRRPYEPLTEVEKTHVKDKMADMIEVEHGLSGGC